jgi:DNA-binding NarL/FixJ family response regulator
MSKLTQRELEILRLAANSNREIAVLLKLSWQTVKNHFTRIYRKLGVGSSIAYKPRCAALWQALNLGLLDVGDLDPGPLRYGGE